MRIPPSGEGEAHAVLPIGRRWEYVTVVQSERQCKGILAIFPRLPIPCLDFKLPAAVLTPSPDWFPQLGDPAAGRQLRFVLVILIPMMRRASNMDILSLSVLFGAILVVDEVLNGQLKLGRRLLERQSKLRSQQDETLKS